MASVTGHFGDTAEVETSAMEESALDIDRSGDKSISVAGMQVVAREEDKMSSFNTFKMMQWLEAEVDHHKTHLHILKNVGASTEEDNNPDGTEELQQKLTSLSTNRSILKSMLHSIQLGQILIDIMFQSTTEVNAKLQTEVVELIDRITASVSTVLRIHKEVQMQQSILTRLKEECRVLRQENRKSLHELQQLKDKQRPQNVPCADEEVVRLKKECETLTAELDLNQFCLNGVIFGSGVAWATDKKLLDLVLSLGQPMEDFLKEMTVESKD